MPRTRLLVAWLVLIPLSACADNSAGPGYEKRWTGMVVPGSGASCGPSTTATLTRRGDEFVFVPNDGVLIITGRIAADGSLHGSLPLSGADHKPFPLTLDGSLTAQGFTGTYTTPRCQSNVSLHPA